MGKKIADYSDEELHAHGVAMSTADRKCNTATCPCTLTYWDRVLEPKVGAERYQIFVDGWTFGSTDDPEFDWTEANKTYRDRFGWDAAPVNVAEDKTPSRRLTEATDWTVDLDDRSLPFRKGQVVRYPSTQTRYEVLLVVEGSMQIKQVGVNYRTVLVGAAAERMVIVDGEAR